MAREPLGREAGVVMQASQAAIELISRFTQPQTKPYTDPSGVLMIGYGTSVYPSGAKVAEGDEISADEALSYLADSVVDVVAYLNGELTGVALNQNQVDALVSFTYSVKREEFQTSTLLQKLKADDLAGAIRTLAAIKHAFDQDDSGDQDDEPATDAAD